MRLVVATLVTLVVLLEAAATVTVTIVEATLVT